MTLLLIIPRDFLITRKVIKLNRNFYSPKLNFQEEFFFLRCEQEIARFKNILEFSFTRCGQTK